MILFIWIWSFGVITPDVFGYTSHYNWTNSIYGCDVMYYNEEHTSYFLIVNIMLNLIVIIISYLIMAKKLIDDQKDRRRLQRTNPDCRNKFTISKHLRMLILLSAAFTVSVIPAGIFGWGMFDNFLDESLGKQTVLLLQAASSCIYWSMFSKFFTKFF